MLQYRKLSAEEICPQLWDGFIRRQLVGACWRKIDGAWCVRDDPFVDDWSPDDIRALAEELKQTALAGGLVLAAFDGGAMKGFVSVEAEPFGAEGEYLDLTNLHVSEEMRGRGIGTALFSEARAYARERGAKKLYLSAHSAVETIAFYRKLGCVEARIRHQKHIEAEPFDCQLECAAKPPE